MRRAALCTLTLLAVSDAAQALVTSDAFGTHAVVPGVPSYGINLDGVVMVGAASPSGHPLLWGTGCLISDRHVLTAAHLIDEDEDGQVDPELFVFPQSVLFELEDGNVAIEYDVASVQWPESWPAAQGDLAVLTLAEDGPANVTCYPVADVTGDTDFSW